jgi:hypothetical protein
MTEYIFTELDTDKSFNLMDIPSSLLNTKVKVMYHKNYIARLICRDETFHLVPKYVGITTMDALVDWVKKREYTITDVANLTMRIKTIYKGWTTGIKMRRNMLDDFGLIKDIVDDVLLSLEENGAEYLVETLEFLKTVNLVELQERLNADAEYIKPPDEEDEDEETENNDDDEDQEKRHRNFDTLENMCKKHTQKAEKDHQTRTERDAKMEARITAEMEKSQKKLDKLRQKNRTQEQKEQSKQKRIEGKIVCKCGGYYDATNKSHHEKTKKHADWEIASRPSVSAEGGKMA